MKLVVAGSKLPAWLQPIVAWLVSNVLKDKIFGSVFGTYVSAALGVLSVQPYRVARRWVSIGIGRPVATHTRKASGLR